MDDNLIIDLYWQRNEQAVAETEAKYGPYCRSIAYGILQNNQDTEECVNDTWLRAWDSIPPQRPGRLSAFLGRIARNLALDRYDYNHAAKRSGPFDQLLSELSECIPCQRDDFAQLELTQILNSFLHSLPEQTEPVSPPVLVLRIRGGAGAAVPHEPERSEIQPVPHPEQAQRLFGKGGCWN